MPDYNNSNCSMACVFIAFLLQDKYQQHPLKTSSSCIDLPRYETSRKYQEPTHYNDARLKASENEIEMDSNEEAYMAI